MSNLSVSGYRTSTTSYRRRVAIIKRRMLIGMITLTLLVFGVLIGSNLLDSSRSEAESSKQAYKYYTSIQVESGDTLWSIADKYASTEYSNHDTYMKELLALNHLSDTTIHSGQYLTVAYYADVQK
jgi:LysM repeat protein